jgi:hypothetical protein
MRALRSHPMTTLLIGVVAGWCLCAGPAFGLAGPRGLIGAAAAAAICGFPAAITLQLHRMAARKGGQAPLLVMLGGMLFRIVFVLGAGALLQATIEGFDLIGFVLWLMLMYLVTLALEVWLLVSCDGLAPRTGRF